MAGDERRAEVEAVARIVRDESPYAVKHSTATRIAERAIAALARCRALDRLRDARGDDEAGRARYPKMLHGEAATAARHAEHARSPQDEDHEAGLVHCVGCDDRRCEGIESPTHDAEAERWLRERDTVLAHINTYGNERLHDALRTTRAFRERTPSRGGTVAVEDVVGALRESNQFIATTTPWPGRDELFERNRRLLAEFARSATGEQTDHGGDQ